MKNLFVRILPFFLIADLIIPFLLAPTYKDYNSLTQVMSVLGNKMAPLHDVYNIWLVLLGIEIFIAGFSFLEIISKESNVLSIIIFSALVIYALGGCFLSGIFSVGETKSVESIAAKIHGFGSAIGFIVLAFVPLFLGMFFLKKLNIAFGIISYICFGFAILYFLFFPINLYLLKL